MTAPAAANEARIGHEFAKCVSLVRGRPPVEVLRGLARETTIVVGPGPVDAAEAWVQEEAQYGTMTMAFVAWAVSLGAWTLAVEEIGWQGVTPEVVAPLSVGSELVSYYWSADADMRFVRAVDGEVVRDFDPLLYGAEAWSRGVPLPEEAGLPFGEIGEIDDAAFALLERLTGLPVRFGTPAPDRLAIAMVVGEVPDPSRPRPTMQFETTPADPSDRSPGTMYVFAP
jgi:hypothetical protein